MPDVPLPVLDSDERIRQRIAAELADLIDGEVRFDRHDRLLYATDASIYQVEPVGVVIPRTTADIETVVRYCAERGVAVLPRGGGTSLAGQAVNAAVVIDLSGHCHALLAVDAARRRARVESGIVLDHLNAALAGHGLMFGPDVASASHATLGGMIGNNSSGAHSILYGRTVEHVEAMNVMLADGTRLSLCEGRAEADERVRALTAGVADIVRPLEKEIEKRFPKTRRRVNGYNLDLMLDQLRASTAGTFDRVNLAHLLCGSEGTLAVTLEATLRLVEAPKRKALAIVAFPDVDHALGEVEGILTSQPAAVELLDDVIIDLARANIEYRHYVDLLPTMGEGPTGAVLYVEYLAEDWAPLHEKLAWLGKRFGGGRTRQFLDDASMTAAWRLRSAGEPLLYGMPGRRKPVTFIEDTAVEPARLPQYIHRLRAIIDAHGTRAAYFAHASVGCLHIRPMICLKDPADVHAMRAIAAETTELVMEFGGALSGEHGDGRLRSHLLERFYGRAICDGFSAIRRLFDPDNRLNPGNITDPPAMDERLRVRPRDRLATIPEIRTFFRYEREGGFGGAVEMCNGAGVCRSLDPGVMCPSFRATRDERHSTRGRGNALRLAITGQLASPGSPRPFGDAETIRTLDLCLACKACKRECPSNVDVAKLKAEYLAQSYRQAGGAPLRAKVLGSIRRLNRLAASMPLIANPLLAHGPARWVLNRALGLAPQRRLPRVQRSLFRWARSRRPPSVDETAPAIVLFGDCFTAYNEPRVGRAAIGVLEKLGYRVWLEDLGCCGRSLISQGLLEEATTVCAATAKRLLRRVEETNAVAVVGCEPSCIAAIADDWLDLDMDVEGAALERLAGRTMLIDRFIEANWDHHPIPPALRPEGSGQAMLVHGHCHQKALWGVDETISLLRRTTDRDVDLIESTCCGMAGAFGYERDHHELSMAIGELSLFPAIRAAPRAAIVAPGMSCRQQILDGTGRRALHPIEILARALAVEA